MTITTSTGTRRSSTSAAPSVSLRRGMILSSSRGEPRPAPRATWIGRLTVER